MYCNYVRLSRSPYFMFVLRSGIFIRSFFIVVACMFFIVLHVPLFISFVGPSSFHNVLLCYVFLFCVWVVLLLCILVYVSIFRYYSIVASLGPVFCFHHFVSLCLFVIVLCHSFIVYIFLTILLFLSLHFDFDWCTFFHCVFNVMHHMFLICFSCNCHY